MLLVIFQAPDPEALVTNKTVLPLFDWLELKLTVPLFTKPPVKLLLLVHEG